MYEIDIRKILFAFLRRWWLIVGAALLGGAVALLATEFLITPLYSATIKLYVNNSQEAGTLISSSDISASKSLVDTYITIIRSDTVLDEVLAETQLPYSPKEMNSMIAAGAMNAAEIFYITATSADPAEATTIVNAIARVAPEHLLEIVDGSSVKVVDFAKQPASPSSPNMMTNVALGAFAGFALAAAAILLAVVFNTRLSSVAELRELADIPVLGVVTDFTVAEKTGYYSYEYGYGYGQSKNSKGRRTKKEEPNGKADGDEPENGSKKK